MHSKTCSMHNKTCSLYKKQTAGKRKRTVRTLRKGGKWSMKYKKSINCKRPKGFSQKQYCKHSRNKK